MGATPAGIPSPDQRFESDRIHASATVLILGALGLALLGAGRLVDHGQAGQAFCCAGLIVIALALVLHVEHLTFRVGRSAVVLIIVGVAIDALGYLLQAVGLSGSSITWIVIGVGRVVAGAGVAMVAVHKEGQMKAALAEYASGAPWHGRVTVHASFLSLITGASGLVLLGFGLIAQDISDLRVANVVQTAGCALIAVGIISQVGHLASRIGKVAVIAVIIGVLAYGVNGIPDLIDPDNGAAHETFWHVSIGIGALFGALACLLTLVKKIRSD